jgi:Domain of unknown function (DUF4911)
LMEDGIARSVPRRYCSGLPRALHTATGQDMATCSHRIRAMSESAPKSDASPPAAMAEITLLMAPVHIALFKAIVESYDNLATLRTDDPRIHRLKLYFAPEAAAEVEALLESLQADFALQRL